MTERELELSIVLVVVVTAILVLGALIGAGYLIVRLLGATIFRRR